MVRGPYGIGSEVVPIVLTGCGEFEVFGMGITAVSQSALVLGSRCWVSEGEG